MHAKLVCDGLAGLSKGGAACASLSRPPFATCTRSATSWCAASSRTFAVVLRHTASTYKRWSCAGAWRRRSRAEPPRCAWRKWIAVTWWWQSWVRGMALCRTHLLYQICRSTNGYKNYYFTLLIILLYFFFFLFLNIYLRVQFIKPILITRVSLLSDVYIYTVMKFIIHTMVVSVF